MLTILGVLAPIIILIALGQILARIDFPGTTFWPALERLTYYILYPALLFGSIARSNLASLDAGNFSLVLLGSLAAMALFLAITRRVLNWGGPRYTSIYQGSMRWNGFVALAISDAYLGTDGLAMTAVGIAVMVPALNVLSIFTLTRHAGAEPQSIKRVLVLLVQNPLIIACVAGILASLLGFSIGIIANHTLSLLGDAALTMGLLAIGAALQIRLPRSAALQLGLVTFFKLALMPVFVATGCYLLQVTGVAFQAAMICAAVPTATSAYILARQLGGDAEFMAQAVTASTLAAAISLPLILYLTR